MGRSVEERAVDAFLRVVLESKIADGISIPELEVELRLGTDAVLALLGRAGVSPPISADEAALTA